MQGGKTKIYYIQKINSIRSLKIKYKGLDDVKSDFKLKQKTYQYKINKTISISKNKLR